MHEFLSSVGEWLFSQSSMTLKVLATSFGLFALSILLLTYSLHDIKHKSSRTDTHLPRVIREAIQTQGGMLVVAVYGISAIVICASIAWGAWSLWTEHIDSRAWRGTVEYRLVVEKLRLGSLIALATSGYMLYLLPRVWIDTRTR